jgi:hypothetical protein
VWIPNSEQEIIAAIEAGDLVETATFDAKKILPAKGKSKDLAIDVAAMANDGGTLLYGVGEDELGRPTIPKPFELVGAKERVDQIVRTSIELGVIAAIQIHARPIERDSNRRASVFESGDQKRRVVAIGWGAEAPYGDALSAYGRGAFGALFAPVHRAPARLLAAARSLGDAAVYRHLRKLKADVSVVGFEHYRPQGVDHPSLYPLLVAALAQRGGGAPFVCDSAVGAAEDQNLHQLLEDYPVGDAGTVTP